MNAHIFSALAVALGVLGLTWPRPAQGQEPAAAPQLTFASPAEAAQALIKAAKARDHEAIHQIFGPEVTNLFTGDKTLDERHLEEFAGDLTERCEPVPQGSNQVTLEIGPGRWPFPIPLIQTNGAWLFDTIAGEDEIFNRHIGRDEYYAIGVCRAYVAAQRQYAERCSGAGGTPEYARRFLSQPGRKDGLYWPREHGEKPSPLSPFVAEAGREGYNWKHGRGPRPFHGYVFKILTRQGPAAPGGEMNYVRHGRMTGGFALVAYPARWDQSGIMTFLVNQDAVVYQRNLGETTEAMVAAMKEYNPDSNWKAVREEGIPDLIANGPDNNPQ